MKEVKLTAEERQELMDWDPGLLELPIHRELEYQMGLCMQGVENAIVVGARGVGKTHSVKWFLEEFAAEEAEKAMADVSYYPREVLYFAASRATGTKTVLIDLYEQIFGGMSRAALRFHTASSLIGQIVSEVERRQISLICVDEAQMIDAKNLDLLRQITDGGRERGHAVGLMLVGNEELRESLVEIKQLGQRFSAEIRFPLIDRKSVGPHLTAFHPHLPRLQDTLGDKAWGRLESDLFAAAAGKFRRLVTILRNANALALRLNRPIEEQILRLAIDKLASEV